MARARSGRAAAGAACVLAVVAAAAMLGLDGRSDGVRAAEAKAGPYRSPEDVAWSPDGTCLAVSDHTAASLVLIDAAGAKVAREVALKGEPMGVAWAADGKKVYVAELGAGTVAEVDAEGGKVVRRLPVGLRPAGVAVAAKRQLLLACNTATNDVSVVDLASGKEKTRIRASRDPFAVAVTPDERLALVTNLAPAMSAADPSVSAVVSLLDLETLGPAAEIRLPAGSTLVRQAAVSADGKWAYVAHTVGRTTLPTTQLERGWVNTNALSILDLEKRCHYATVLLDYLFEGAANPWGVALAKDGKTAWVTLSGIHQVARIDLANLHKMLVGEAPEGDAAKRSTPTVWADIKKDPKNREALVNDLAALYGPGLIVRTAVPCNGPRGIALAPDGGRLAIAGYYTGEVLLVDPATCKVAGKVALGPVREPDPVRRGEIVFNDATQCFQHWLSCATCHPDDARTDGMNWDLLNDGIGNPKNTKSLLLADKTPPMMAHGVREDMAMASLSGFRFILFREPEKADVEAVKAYLVSLTPAESPYLVKGKLSARAKKGKAVFESSKTACASCHEGALFTNLKVYDVGTRGPLDSRAEFDTPTLIELWRTAPYLHHGEATTLQEVFTKFNSKDQHGKTSHLSKQELDDLVEYLLSL